MMKFRVVFYRLTLFGVLSAVPVNLAHGADDELVSVDSVDYSIKSELRFAQSGNGLKRKLYPEVVCVLRRKAAMALSRAQAVLKLQGKTLRVVDCYRPLSLAAEIESLTSVPQDAKFDHSRGVSVDATLDESEDSTTTSTAGRQKIPGEVCDEPAKKKNKKAKSNRSFERLSQQTLALLTKAMQKEGFVSDPSRPWHFQLSGTEGLERLDIPLDKFVKKSR